MIDITGLDKSAVLAALYNASKPVGLGFIQAGHAGPFDMSVGDASELLKRYGDDPFIDYLQRRPIKVDLSGDEFDPWGFDRDNGDGAAERAITHLRDTGSVRRADGSSFADTEMTEEQMVLFLNGALAKDAERKD